MISTMIKNIQDDIPGFWNSLRIHLGKKGKSAPRVVIHGGYGKRNMGDDALFYAIYTRVRKHLPNAKITAICHGPQQLLLWQPDISAFHFKSFKALNSIFKSDVYIIGGGGIINRINTYSGNMTFKLFDMKGKFMLVAALLAQLCGAKSVFYGIGAESFPDIGVKLLTRLAFNYADTVSVRDPLSMQNLKKAGVNSTTLVNQS